MREALGASSIGGRELRGLPVEVYLFGSRADGTARMSSDLDIGVLPTGPLLADALARLREAFDESTIPYEVDLVDLSRVAPRFASASCERVGSGSPE